MSHRRLFANAASNTLGFVAQLVVSLFMARVVLRALGDERYGVWSFVESFLAYLMLFDLGVAAALVRFVPRCLAAHDRAGLNRVFSTCLAFFAAVAAVAGPAGWLFLQFFADHLLKVPDELRGEVRLVFLAAVVSFAAGLPLSVFPAMLDGLNAFTTKTLTRTVFLLTRVPALLLALRGESPLLKLVLVLTASNLLESLTLAGLVFRRLPGLRFVPREIDRGTVRMIRGYSLDSFLAMIAGRLSFSTDAFVIGSALGAAAITPFNLANRLVDLAKSVLRSVTTTLTPAVSALEATGDLGAVRAYFLHGTRLVLYLVLPIQVGLYVLGKPFLTIWLERSEYAAASGPTLWILASTLSLTIAQSVASRVLYGMGRIRLFARVAVLEGVTNLLVSLLLVWPLGIEGVAWGTALPHVGFCLFAIVHASQLIDVHPRAYLRAWAKPLTATALLAGVWLARTWAANPATWAELVTVGLVGIVPYAVLVGWLEAWQWITIAMRHSSWWVANKVARGTSRGPLSRH
jgi:O-antigen/teichoic acid export membrane protein